MRRDHLLMRALGVAVGLGFLILGLLALLADPGMVAPGVAGRVRGLGVTLLVAGLLAVAGSLAVRDPHGIW
jgi:hypothetical protein